MKTTLLLILVVCVVLLFTGGGPEFSGATCHYSGGSADVACGAAP